MRTATFTLAALGVLTCATSTRAANNGVVSPGAIVSVYYSPRTSWELAAGVDVSYMNYRGSFFRGDLGRGAYAQVQGIFDPANDRTSRARFVAGGQLAKYTVLGGMSGLVFETGDHKVPASFGVEAAPYLSMGLMSVWASITFPISDLFVPRPRGFQFGMHLAGKLPITVHGSSVYKDITLASGRPLRACDGRPRVARVRGAVRERTIAAMWARDASMEHASVAAFGRIALELMALGAPLELVDEAHRAARDEIAHAEACFAIASFYAGASLQAGPLPIESRAPELMTLALETYVDGCVGESAAAAAARFAERHATVPAVKRALRMIARDEKRHADLAWSILAWCIGVDARVFPTVLHAARELLSSRVCRPRPHALAAHGYVDDDARSALQARESNRAYVRLSCLAPRRARVA